MKNNVFIGLKYLLFIYLVVTVLLPMGSLFGTIRREDAVAVFSSA